MPGGDEFRDFGQEMKAKAKAQRGAAGQVVRAVGSRIQRDAQINAAVDTGALRSSITMSATGSNATVARAEIGPTVNYGRYVEEGTYKMAAQPYLFPAADRHEQSFYDAMAKLAEL